MSPYAYIVVGIFVLGILARSFAPSVKRKEVFAENFRRQRMRDLYLWLSVAAAPVVAVLHFLAHMLGLPCPF
jgi:hypothetical protein